MNQSELIKEQEVIISRLNDVVNGLRVRRPYSFTPEKLTVEEQQIIGDCADLDIIRLIDKWFKMQADKNNDLLVHSFGKPNITDSQKSLWALAVLVYEDWSMFLSHCKKTSESK